MPTCGGSSASALAPSRGACKPGTARGSGVQGSVLSGFDPLSALLLMCSP